MAPLLAYDTPIRPIEPGNGRPAPADGLPAPRPTPASFIDEMRKILSGLLGR